jgi:SulP family sulfate permease
MNLLYKPRLLDSLKGYTPALFAKDLTAGLTVGVLALPLAIAFGIASGVTPERGLITAILAGFLISFLGGSDVQIGGPTGAFIVIVAAAVANFGYEGLVLATLIAGVMIVIMGLVKFGSVIRLIPYPVILGFTSGIALIIFSSQAVDFLGLNLTEVPAEFFHKWKEIILHIREVNFFAFGIAVATILIVVLLRKVSKRIPGALVAMILATLAVILFRLPVSTIGSRFGEIKQVLPEFQWFGFSWDLFIAVLPTALSIAMLAGIESLLSAVVADGMTGGQHDSNSELVGQGIANIACALFGGIPATGAIARTAANVRNGGKTPVAGIIHALTLFAITLFLAPYAKLIPLATLAGILAVVAWDMSELKAFGDLLRGSRSDAAVLILTFLLTVFTDLTVAIPVGIVLALLIFIQKMRNQADIRIITGEYEDESDLGDPWAVTKRKLPEGVIIYEIQGPMFFGAAEKFKEILSRMEKPPKVLIMRMRYVPVIDATGIRVLESFHKLLARHEGTLLLSGLQSGVLRALEKAKLLQAIGAENLPPHMGQALARARDLLGLQQADLAEKIEAGGVFRDVSGHNAESLIRAGMDRIPLFGNENREALTASVMEREALFSTWFGHGIAVPHTRSVVSDHPSAERVAVLYPASGPLDWNGENTPVSVIFLILSGSPESHLATLAEIGKLSKKEGFAELIARKPTQKELLEYLRR